MASDGSDVQRPKAGRWVAFARRINPEDRIIKHCYRPPLSRQPWQAESKDRGRSRSAGASALRSSHLVPWLCGCGMTFMVAVLIGRTADSLASIPERLAQPTVERPYPLPELELAAHTRLERLDAAWLEHRIRPGESFYQIMGAMGFDPGTVQSVMDSGKQARPLLNLRPGQVLRANAPDGELQALDLEIDSLNKLEIRRDDDGYFAQLHTRPTETTQSQTAGVITSSLYLSAQQAGLSDRLTLELAEMFGWDIDFTQDLQPGDRFAVVYNEIRVDGEKVRDGDILAAEFVNRGKTLRAVRYTDPDGRTGIYKPDGSSLRKAFNRNPLPVTRITSRFNPNRVHPVFKTVRPHRGVDYGAPTGTPVRVTGDGRVAFAGRQRGYGNVVIIEHSRGIRTLYAHLSRFAPKLRSGQAVEQGKVIGYVGSSGWATGPHLHYEFQVNGKTKDPLTVALPQAQELPQAYRRHFTKQTGKWVAALDTLSTRQVAESTNAKPMP